MILFFKFLLAIVIAVPSFSVFSEEADEELKSLLDEYALSVGSSRCDSLPYLKCIGVTSDVCQSDIARIQNVCLQETKSQLTEVDYGQKPGLLLEPFLDCLDRRHVEKYYSKTSAKYKQCKEVLIEENK